MISKTGAFHVNCGGAELPAFSGALNSNVPRSTRGSSTLNIIASGLGVGRVSMRKDCMWLSKGRVAGRDPLDSHLRAWVNASEPSSRWSGRAVGCIRQLGGDPIDRGHLFSAVWSGAGGSRLLGALGSAAKTVQPCAVPGGLVDTEWPSKVPSLETASHAGQLERVERSPLGQGLFEPKSGFFGLRRPRFLHRH